MSELPQFSKTFLKVLEHFKPVAVTIHPELEKDQILSIAIELAIHWLDKKTGKAIELFYETNGIILCSKPSSNKQHG